MLDNKFDKFIVSVYTKEKMEEDNYERIKLAFKESINPEDILKKEFSTFNRIKFNEKINRFFVFFDNIDEFDYDSYIKVFIVDKL